MAEPGSNTSPVSQPGKCKCGKKLVKKYIDLGFCATCYKKDPICKCGQMLKNSSRNLGELQMTGMCEACYNKTPLVCKCGNMIDSAYVRCIYGSLDIYTIKCATPSRCENCTKLEKEALENKKAEQRAADERRRQDERKKADEENSLRIQAHHEALKKRVYLSVTHSEGDEASELGAKYDSDCKQWYAPNGEPELVSKWPVNNTPVVLINEDRTFGGNELYVDLIPASCWFTNVRYCVHPRDWDRLRRHVYNRANNCCECCGTPGKLDAHERWHYDNQTQVQKLVRLVALCRVCHRATHLGHTIMNHEDSEVIGLANCIKANQPRIIEARDKFMKLRNFTVPDIRSHFAEALNLNKIRSEIVWTLDLSLITDNGIALKTAIPDKDARKKIAVDRLAESDSSIIPQHHTINVSNDWFNYILSRKVTSICQQNQENVAKIQSGDMLVITGGKYVQSISTLVKAVIRYKSLREYIEGEGLPATLPNISTIEKGIRFYHQDHKTAPGSVYDVYAIRI